MRDYINVYDDNDNLIKMEVVLIFKLDGYKYNYIAYKEIDGDNIYISRYLGKNIVSLDNNLSDKEFELSQKILEGVMR